MGKTTITLPFDEDKLDALEIFLKKDGTSVQKKLEEALKKLYEEVVPEAVREFMDAKSGGKPKRQTAPSKTKTGPKSKTEPRKEITNYGQS